MIDIGSGLKQLDVEIMKNRVQIGQKIKFKNVICIGSDLIEGTVIEKYPHHCLVDTGLFNTSVTYIDLILFDVGVG